MRTPRTTQGLKRVRALRTLGYLFTLGLLVTACETTPDTSQMSPWQFAEYAFNEAILSDEMRPSIFSTSALKNLKLFDSAQKTRWKSLGVRELRHRRSQEWSGEVLCAVDDWPMAIEFNFAFEDGHWKVNTIERSAELARWLALLDDDGLPELKNTTPWQGGLSGYDHHGRLNAGVLVVAVGGRVYIDGFDEVGTGRVLRGTLKRINRKLPTDGFGDG